MKNYHYEKMMLTAKGIARKVHFRTGVPFEDLIGEANLAYVQCLKNYDPEKGDFKAYFGASCFNGMVQFCQKEYSGLMIPYDEEYAPHQNPATEETFLSDLYDSLSAEAKEMVNTILECPEEMTKMAFKNAQKRITKGVLRGFFTEYRGWSHKVIAGCFAEIKGVLNGI
jgi:DNA-directed RNA polymerase specialized sigma subunit